jgi:hypothetical protein
MLLSVFASGRLRCAFIGVALPLKVAKSKWVYSLDVDGFIFLFM